MRSFHTPTQKIPPTSKNSPTKSQIFTKILKPSISPYFSTKITPHQNFPHLSNPISPKPLFHNTFPPSLTQNLTKNFHKLTLPSQLSSLYKGIFTMYYFYVKKITIQLFSKSKIFKPSTENNNVSNKSKIRRQKLCV